MIKNFKRWYKRIFGTYNKTECNELNLTFCFNIYGDAINRIGCRSIWKDSKGRYYRGEQLLITTY